MLKERKKNTHEGVCEHLSRPLKYKKGIVLKFRRGKKVH